MDLQWWISIIFIPLVGALFGADFLLHRGQQKDSDALHARISAAQKEGREAAERVERQLNEFKLFVAQYYASMAYAKEIEARVSGALGRIENKLDKLDERLQDLKVH